MSYVTTKDTLHAMRGEIDDILNDIHWHQEHMRPCGHLEMLADDMEADLKDMIAELNLENGQ